MLGIGGGSCPSPGLPSDTCGAASEDAAQRVAAVSQTRPTQRRHVPLRGLADEFLAERRGAFITSEGTVHAVRVALVVVLLAHDLVVVGQRLGRHQAGRCGKMRLTGA